MKVLSLLLALTLMLSGCGRNQTDKTLGDSSPFTQKDAHLAARLIPQEGASMFKYIDVAGEQLPCLIGDDMGSNKSFAYYQDDKVSMEIEVIDDVKEKADYLVWELTGEQPHGNSDYAHAVYSDVVYICERLDSGRLARVTVRNYSEYYDKDVFRNSCLLYGIDPEGGLNA